MTEKSEESAIKEFTGAGGNNVFKIDTSEKACRVFGFNPNQKIIDRHGNPATVIGVAPVPGTAKCLESSVDVLWISYNADTECEVYFAPNPGQLSIVQ